MLEALKPIFRHWAAQLAQISAHAETLLNMLESTRVSKNVQQQRDAIEDLNVLGPILSESSLVSTQFSFREMFGAEFVLRQRCGSALREVPKSY